MARPRKQRCCRRYRADRIYKPRGIPMKDMGVTFLSADQFEALRLCDVEACDQKSAGRKMGISRGTIQRLLYSARRQIIEAMVSNQAIIVNLKESEASE